MSKITLTNLVNLQNETTAVNAINGNNATLTTALDNTLSRDGTTPNQMGANLDMNSFKILNLPPPTSNYEPLRVIDASTLNGGGSITISPLPVGGTVGQVLAKNSSTNYDASWRTSGNVPVGGLTGQILTKNSSSDNDASWKYSNVTIVTPEQFGYTSYGSGDAGPAINSAISSVSGPVKVILGPYSYNIVTPVVITKFSVWLQGQGDNTTLTYSPISNNTSMITWNGNAIVGLGGIYYGRLTDMRILSADSSFVKTAINLMDVGDMEVSGLVVGPGWHDATNNSVALKTNGRQCVEFRRLELFADKPIVILPNPNNTQLSADHFHFSNLYLIATGNPCITVDNSVVFSNTVFDGFQAWVGGTYGFYYPGTTSPGRSYNLSFSNIRTEGGTSGTAYSMYIDASHAGMFGLSINNSVWDTARKGAFLRGCSVSLRDIYFPAISSTEALNMDNTNLSIRVDNCRWESGCTQNIGTLLTKYSYNYPGNSTTVPSNALYSN